METERGEFGRLSLLRDVTGSLLIPDAVYEEIAVKKGGMLGGAEVAELDGFREPLSQTARCLMACRAFCTKESAKH
jgi:hypothetical protein